MNRQEVFDKAVAGLRSQGFEKSMDHGTCSYRADDGKKCAIGWLVDDADYNPALEGRSANVPEVIEMARLYPRNCMDEHFLVELQEAHDYSTSADHMKERLEQVAKRYRVDPKEIYA